MNTTWLPKIILLLALHFSNAIYAQQEIAITFDDAPTFDGPIFSGKERTAKILSHLKNEHVDQVAFFVVTANIKANGSARLKQYANAGHLLANHTQSHQWIHQMGVQEYCNDIRQADSVLRTMNGFTPWFRYPFLDEGRTKPVRDTIRNTLKDLGLSNGYVTIDNYDWYLNNLLKKAVDEDRKINFNKLREVYIDHIWTSIRFYDQIGQRVLGRSPRHVLLLHENDLAAYFIGDLIRFLKSKGWKIISPTKAYEDPIAKDAPDVLFNGQGRVAALARAGDAAARELVQDSEDEAYLDKLVKAQKVFE